MNNVFYCVYYEQLSYVSDPIHVDLLLELVVTHKKNNLIKKICMSNKSELHTYKNEILP